MPTYIYSKKDFIQFIEEQVDENELIVFTDSFTGLSSTKKKGLQVNNQFASQAFKDDGVGHIMRGDTFSLGIQVTKKTSLSAEGIKTFEQIAKS